MGANGATLRGGASVPRAASTPARVSPTSTGGRLVDQGSGTLYGENDNGYSAAVLDTGRSDFNMFRYGSRQIYEVHYNSDSRVDVRPVDYVSTKAEARRLATAYLKETE